MGNNGSSGGIGKQRKTHCRRCGRLKDRIRNQRGREPYFVCSVCEAERIKLRQRVARKLVDPSTGLTRNQLKHKRYRLENRLRSRIRSALRNQGVRKNTKTTELIGCSLPEFRAYLEEQFKPGMTWENYGEHWHIDHRTPCASYDLSNPHQQAWCFNYTNLQPLWAEENLRKGAKE